MVGGGRRMLRGYSELKTGQGGGLDVSTEEKNLYWRSSISLHLPDQYPLDTRVCVCNIETASRMNGAES